MPPQIPRNADSSWLASLVVLYVEDDPMTREQLTRFLRRRVGRVVEASDGAEGLALFLAERPSMVITDIQMPRMDGLTMAEEIRRVAPGVPLIVTTAFEQIGYLERSIDAGVDKYVTKPVDTDKLEAALLVCARRHRAEALLAQERRREVEALHRHEREALGLLAGGMAHDFNNLLQSVLGNIDLALPLAEPGTELRDLLGSAMESTLQAADLGGKLLTLSQSWSIDREARPIQPTLLSALTAALAGSHVDLKLDLSPDLPEIPHDAELLGHAFGQLATNAREAMADTGTLSVTGEVRSPSEGERLETDDGRFLRLTLRDSGHGIAPEILPRVFDPYFSTKQRGTVRGMGLGLALCAAIVRKHGGVVSASSAPGQGAVLTVLLPLAASPDRPR